MGCWAAATAVARVSLEISAGGARTGIPKGSGLGRKIPGGCCAEFLSEPNLGAGKGHAQGRRREGCSAATGFGGMLR